MIVDASLTVFLNQRLGECMLSIEINLFGFAFAFLQDDLVV